MWCRPVSVASRSRPSTASSPGGAGKTRSEVIRRAVDHLADSVERARIGTVIAASYRAQPQTANDDAEAMANAIAMTEAEPW